MSSPSLVTVSNSTSDSSNSSPFHAPYISTLSYGSSSSMDPNSDDGDAE
jgi:hypothetical protein